MEEVSMAGKEVTVVDVASQVNGEKFPGESLLNREEDAQENMERLMADEMDRVSSASRDSELKAKRAGELEVAGERERELTESLNAIIKEKRESEKALHDFVDELHDAEDLIEGLRSELSATQGKLWGTENDLRDAEIRECEILEKLKCAEGKLEQQDRVLEETTATLRKETELQLEALNNKDSEVKFLRDELQIAEHQKLVKEEKAAEAKDKVADLVEELDLGFKKLADTEGKVGELQVLLDSSVETAEELRNQLARSQERQSEVEASFLQAQAEINEAGPKLSHKEMEAKKLSELLGQTEEKLMIYEVQLHESDSRVESTKGKLREASVKMAYQENMIEKLEDALSQLETQNGDLEGEKMKLKAELAELESKLKSAEGQVKQKGKALEKANARNMELQSLSEYLSNYVEIRIQEVTEILNRKEAGIKSLVEELQAVTIAKMDYEEQAVLAADKVAALEDELDRSSTKLASLESLNEELKKMLEDAEGKCAETLSENEPLAKTNLDLKSKVGELQELLKLAIVEKQKVVWELASSMNTIEELKNQLAMSHKLQSEAEARFLQAQTELNRYEVHLHNSAAMEESRKFELEQTFAEFLDEEKKTELLEAKLSQLQTHNGDLEEANLKLSQLQSQIALIMEQKQVLERELIATRGKLRGIEDDLNASETREDEVVKRLKYAEGQAEQQGKALEEANAKNKELESLIETSRKDIELKLQEAMGTLDSKEAEAKLLAERLQLRNPHIKPSEHQSEVEARLLQVEMELHEKTEILTQKELEVKELSEALNALQAELCAKNAAVENFNSSMKMIEDLKQEWAFERQCFESKIASIREQKERISEAAAISQNLLQLRTCQLLGRLKESGESYKSLEDVLEHLEIKAAETTALQTRLKELEEELFSTKGRFAKEMENILAKFTTREIERTSKLGQLKQETQHEDAPIEKNKDEIQQATEEQVNKPELKLQEEETKPGAIAVAERRKKVQANEGKNIKAVIGVAVMSIIIGLVLKKK